MNSIESIIQQAISAPKRIVLPEANDLRVLRAAQRIEEQSIAVPVLSGNPDAINQLAMDNGVNLDHIEIVDIEHGPGMDKYIDTLIEARKHKGMTLQEASGAIRSPLVHAVAMVKAGDADGCVAGAINPTSNVVRAALQVIGMNGESSMVSSFFLMQHNLPHQAIQGAVLFADCGLVIEPDANQLAQIAIQSSQSASTLLGISPTVALLSFSTAGSASHPNVDKVKQAGEIIKSHRPDLALMTEVQFDAAVLPEVLKSKAPEIEATAPANVFIFPDLQSGNIGYKIAQRLGGVEAIGPILQGLAKPVNDLSRGCSIDDIVKLVAVTSVQASQVPS